jgi:hypothetical protein
MTGICKDDNREALESRDKSSPFYNSDNPSVRHGVPLGKVIDYEYYEISDRNQSYDTGVFQRI